MRVRVCEEDARHRLDPDKCEKWKHCRSKAIFLGTKYCGRKSAGCGGKQPGAVLASDAVQTQTEWRVHQDGSAEAVRWDFFNKVNYHSENVVPLWIRIREIKALCQQRRVLETVLHISRTTHFSIILLKQYSGRDTRGYVEVRYCEKRSDNALRREPLRPNYPRVARNSAIRREYDVLSQSYWVITLGYRQPSFLRM